MGQRGDASTSLPGDGGQHHGTKSCRGQPLRDSSSGSSIRARGPYVTSHPCVVPCCTQAPLCSLPARVEGTKLTAARFHCALQAFRRSSSSRVIHLLMTRDSTSRTY